MNKQGFLNFLTLAVFYALALSLPIVLQITSIMRQVGTPELVKQADTISWSYGGIFLSIIIIIFAVRLHLYIHYLTLSNDYPRQNMTIITPVGKSFEEGVGIVDKDEVLISRMKAEDCINDPELAKMYIERREWLKKSGISDTDMENKRLELKEMVTKRGLVFEREYPEVTVDNYDFYAYKMESLVLKEMPSYFKNKNDISFLKKNGVNEPNDLVMMEEDDLSRLQADHDKTRVDEKVVNPDGTVTYNYDDLDIKSIQTKILNNIDFFSREEINFFIGRGIHNVGQLIKADLNVLSKEFNNHFKIKSVKEHIVNNYLRVTGKNYKSDSIDLNEVVKDLRKRIVETEKSFVYNLSADSRFRHTYMKLIVMKSVHYDYHGYIMEFDKNIVIPVGKSYHAGEMLERFIRKKPKYEDEDEMTINRALVILPTSLDNAHKYTKGVLSDFHGMMMKTEQLTDVEYVFRGMLDSDHGVFICNNCTYLQDAIRFNSTIDPETIQKYEKNALVEILNNTIVEREGFAKLLRLQTTRVRKKDDENDLIFSKMIDDIEGITVANKITMQPEPFNAYHTVMMIIAFILGLAIATAAVLSFQSMSASMTPQQTTQITQFILSPLLRGILKC